MNVIELTDLKKYYGKNRGVEDASFSLAPKEILGFIGPNGAGKSTVIRVIMGLIQKTSGDVKVFGQDPSPNVNAKIGYMPSEIFMYNELSVGQQLSYLGKLHQCSSQKWEELAQYFDLDLNRRIRELSFGNKKKLGIIAALMHEPDLIILDEPTSGLDPLIQKKFFELLEQERNRGASILLSSHVLNDIEKICDRVCLIKDGKVLFTEGLMDLKKTRHKRVVISPIIQLDIPNLSYLKTNHEEITYSFSGDINLLIKALSSYELTKLHIDDLQLEEIFLHYYQKEVSHD
ncbi:MAG: ABC transporter ATP-binding protein [Bacilli bacterium]